MSSVKARYLELASKEAFQEIADSPTTKYYTNWKEFERRLQVGDSQEYSELPAWVKGLGEGIVVLAGAASVAGDLRVNVTFPGEVDVIGEIGVTGKMEYYNAARLKASVSLRVPEGVDAGRIVVVSQAGDGYTGHHVRLDLERNSEAEVVLVDLGGPWESSIKTFTVAVTADAGSRLRVYSLSLHDSSAVYSRRVYRLKDASRLELYTFYSSGPATRINEDVYLEGEKSEVEIASSALSRGSAWGDVVLNVRHRGARSNSSINGRGVALDEGILTLRGVAIIEGEAAYSSSSVEVHVSTFGESARGNASPMLEIHTGAVEKAYHSASVSSLTESELFYLAARGLGEEEAKALLVEGTLQYSGVLERLGVPLESILALRERGKALSAKPQRTS